MTKKFIIITAIILLMSVVGCVAAYATIYEKDIENVAVEPEVIPEDEKDIPKDYTSYGSIFFENKFAEKELTLKLYDGTIKDVTYEHSTTFNGTDILKNIYIDKSNNEYFIDSNGTLIGFFRNPSYYNLFPMTTGESIPEDKWVGEEKAIEAAKEHINSFYGDIIDKLKLVDNKITDEAVYEYEFVITAGKDDSVTAVKCLVDVLFDGRIISSAIHGYAAYHEINVSKLDRVSAEVLLDHAVALAKSAYGDDYINIDITGTELQMIGGQHVIRIVSTVDIKTELGDIGGASETFYYPIS